MISERTLIPISLVLVLIGAAMWVARIESSVANNTKRIDVLDSIDKRLSRIEGRLGVGNEGGK